MTRIQLQRDLLSISIFLTAISSIATYIQASTGIPAANTTLWWALYVFILFSIFSAKPYFFDQSQTNSLLFIKWFIVWNCLSIFHGVLIAENYWDWKNLIAKAMALLIPVIAYSATNDKLIQSILRFYIKYALPLFVIFAFIITPDAYGFYLVPISFLLLFLPVLTLRWKIVLVAIALFVITADLGARSNVIKFSIPVIFSLIYYFRLIIPTVLFELARKLLFITPILFFVLAVTGTFNIFKMEQYIGAEYTTVGTNAYGEQINDNLKADTRTFLYVEVLATAKKYNSWLIGRSPARGYDSIFFGMDDPAGRWERAGSEVAILNIFTWTGIIGVVLYFLVFYSASSLAINHSNNIFSKILGLFVAFRWLYAWVEDINYFTLTTMFLWILIGLCCSKSFRNMDNQEVISWVRVIFDKRYRP